MKRVAVLGSTGSVGENALAVLAAASGVFRVTALSAGENYRRLAEQVSAFKPGHACVLSREHAGSLGALLGESGAEVSSGEQGLVKLAGLAETDVVMVAVAGAAALAPAWEAVRKGKTIALANKECLVMAGELMMGEAERSGAVVLPVDSEHAGIFQALAQRPIEQVSRIILPASGGPFLDADPSELEHVTSEQALSHPTWSMGKKISIDSATLMNKALEVIEARWLFNIAPEKIEVLIHPQSIVHGLVEFIDGSVVAQMSVPDMRHPILQALSWPGRMDAGLSRLDLGRAGALSFRALDHDRFPGPGLAYKALQKGGTAPAVLAAADEAAVHAFLDYRIKFPEIVPLISRALDEHEPGPLDSIETAKKADREARDKIEGMIKK